VTAPVLVSVVIPVHNGAAHLAAAVASAAAQVPPPAEIVVVDDGSTDGSAAIAAGCAGPVRVLRQDRAGPAAARNAGLALARGDAVAFLDHDDAWPPGSLAALAAALDAPPPADLAYGRVRLIGDGLPPPEAPATGRLEGYAVTLGAALIRRALFARIGTFEPTLEIGEDLDWLMRAREHGCAIATIAAVTLWHRVHPGQMTADPSATMRAGAAGLPRSLPRRRAGGRVAESLPGWLPRGIPPDSA